MFKKALTVMTFFTIFMTFQAFALRQIPVSLDQFLRGSLRDTCEVRPGYLGKTEVEIKSQMDDFKCLDGGTGQDCSHKFNKRLFKNDVTVGNYLIKYSFFELTLSKVYYIYDKENTNKVLYKFVRESNAKKSFLYEKLKGKDYKKLISIEYIGKSKSAQKFNYSYEFNVLDENNYLLAHLFFKKKPYWLKEERDYSGFWDKTGLFELRSPSNADYLMYGFKKDKESDKISIYALSSLPIELKLAITSFLIPKTKID